MIQLRNAASSLILSGVVLALGLSCGGGSNQPSSPSSPSVTLPPTTTPPTTTSPSSGLPRSCTGTPTGTLKDCGVWPNRQFEADLEQVLDSVRGRQDVFYPDGVTIRYLDKFRKAVVDGLDAKNLCGIFDYGDNASGIGDTLYIRYPDNATSEAYDVISGSGQVRAGYQSSCAPAVAQPAAHPNYPVQDAACSLPPSGATFCLPNSWESLYGDDVRAAIVAVTVEHPEYFDLNDTLNSELSYRLKDPAAYIAAVIGKLRPKGYCAFEDEELSVKKDNSMDENFDIVRTPAGTSSVYSLFVYKGKCHNAIF